MRTIHLLDLGRETAIYIKDIVGQAQICELVELRKMLYAGTRTIADIRREYITEQFIMNVDKPMIEVVKDIMIARSSQDDLEYTIEFNV